MRSGCGPGARLAPARALVGRLPGPLPLPWSLPLRGSVTALRLRARKERVGVIRRSTMLLSHALSCRLRFLLGEFQSVAEDFESRLLIIESTCLGRFTADTEHLLPPGGEKTHGIRAGPDGSQGGH